MRRRRSGYSSRPVPPMLLDDDVLRLLVHPAAAPWRQRRLQHEYLGAGAGAGLPVPARTTRRPRGTGIHVELQCIRYTLNTATSHDTSQFH
jgi:hypothetical protein